MLLPRALSLALAIACIAPATTAAAVISIYGTGVNNAGVVLPDGTVDPHYNLSLYPGQVGSTPANVFVLGGNHANSYNATGTASHWVSWSANWVNATPAGTWRYRTTFDLTGLDHTTANVTGRFLSDNGGTIFLNGVNTAIQSPSTTVWSPINITTGFVAGLNTVEFQVVNDNFVSFNPSALRVELSGTATAVPEPGSVVLILMAVLSKGAFRWRFQRENA